MNVIKYILTRSLPKTGQNTVLLTGDDGTYQAGWWKNRTVATNKVRFIDNGDGTITDRATGLMWEKVTLRVTHSLEYWITYASGLTLGGYTNWRVPNINELVSLINYGSITPCIYTVFSTSILPAIYFSSTHFLPSDSDIYYVSFLYGCVNLEEAGNNEYAICVRTI